MSSNLGYQGLFSGSSKAEQSKQNLLVAEQLSQFNSKKRKEQEEDQMKVAAMQDEIRKQTDQLLGYDKKKLNEAKRNAFNIVRQQIAANGGDYSRFRANGGASVLENYKNSILNSDAMISYQENQKNMERILEMEKKGMGHLINPVDRANMQSYQRNKGGKITFTGQLMDVKLPDGKDYDWNTNAPVEDILRYDGNYTKIMNNYAMSFPHLKQPPSEEDLATYVKSMYSVRGTDYQRGFNIRDFNYNVGRDKVKDNQWQQTFDRGAYEFDTRLDWEKEKDSLDREQSTLTLEAQLNAKTGMNPDGSSTSSEKGESPEESFITNVGHLNDVIDNRSISVADWKKGIWDGVKNGVYGQDMAEMQFSPFNLKSGHWGWTGGGAKMSPAQAKFIKNINGRAAAIAALNGNYVVEGNVIKDVITKDTNFYGSNGEIISAKGSAMYNFRMGGSKRDFTIKGVASVGTFGEGDNKTIIMNKTGTIYGNDDKYDKDVLARAKNSKVKIEQMVVAQSPEGELIYIPFNSNDVQTRTRYANQPEANDNITKQRSAMQSRVNREINMNNKVSKQKQVDRDGFISLFNDDKSNNIIKTKSSILGVPNQPGKRMSLLASFYATMASQGGDLTLYSQAVQTDEFEKMIKEAGASAILKGAASDQQNIRALQKAVKDVSQNQFYENWIKNYQNLKNL